MAYTGSQPTYVNFPVDYFSGDGVTNAFNLTYPASAEGSVLITVNNQHIYVNKYTVNNRSLVFSNYTPPVGTNNIEVIYLGIPSISEGVTGVTSVGIASDLSGITITNSPVITAGVMRLGGTLGVANGGTGQTTLAQYNVLLGNGTNAVQTVSTLGSTNQVLTSQGTGASPTWTSIVNSFSAGTTGLTPGGVNTGAITLGGTLNIANGGTGVNTIPINRVILGNGTNPISTVAGSGTTAQVLTSQGVNNAPIWADLPVRSITPTTGLGLTFASSSGAITVAGTLSLANGGTNNTGFIANTMVIANAGGTSLTSLNNGTLGQVLTSTGPTTAPTWQNAGTGTSVTSFSGGTTGLTPNAPTTGVVTLGGTLSVANGGTNATSFTANTVTVSDGTGNSLASLANGTAGQILVSTGATTAPAWQDSPTATQWASATAVPIGGIVLGVSQTWNGTVWIALSNPIAGNTYNMNNTNQRITSAAGTAGFDAGNYRCLGSVLNSANSLWVRIS